MEQDYISLLDQRASYLSEGVLLADQTDGRFFAVVNLSTIDHRACPLGGGCMHGLSGNME